MYNIKNIICKTPLTNEEKKKLAGNVTEHFNKHILYIQTLAK